MRIYRFLSTLGAILFFIAILNGCEDEVTGGPTPVAQCNPACQANEVCVDGTCQTNTGDECIPACDADAECIDGSCQKKNVDQEGTEGSTCKNNDECIEPLICHPNICRKRAKTDEPCSDGLCESGLFCKEGVCAPLPSAGEPCTPALTCAADLLCIQSTCTKLPEIGDVCAGLLEPFCQSSQCINGRCSVFDLGVDGDCSQENGHLCAETLICHEGSCVAPLGDGAECVQGGTPCKEGYLCATGHCEFNQGSCDSSSDCAKDSYCCLNEAQCESTHICVQYGDDPTNNHDDACTYDTKPGIFQATVQCRWQVKATDPVSNLKGADMTVYVADLPYGKPNSKELIFLGYTSGRIMDFALLSENPSFYSGHYNVHKNKTRAVAFHWNKNAKRYEEKWLSECHTYTAVWKALSLHDIDGDGIPELIDRDAVIDPLTGQCKWSKEESGDAINTGTVPIVGDLDNDGNAEIITLDGIRRWKKGAVENGITKGEWEPIAESTFTIGVKGQHTFWISNQYAYADFGTPGATAKDFDFDHFDGKAEIVAAGRAKLALFTLTGQKLMDVSGFVKGGPPTVGDFDNDGRPEIGVASNGLYGVYDPKCEASDPECKRDKVLWERTSQDGSSGVTGSSIFDFDGDGQAEVVYADECFTRIYDGKTGEILFSMRRSSHTGYENPVVADIDNDGSAEIVMPSDYSISCPSVDPHQMGVKCDADEDCISGVCRNGYCRCSDFEADCGKSCTRPSQCPSGVCQNGQCACGDALCNLVDASGHYEKLYLCRDLPQDDDGQGKVCRAHRPNAPQHEVLIVRDIRDRWVSARDMWNQHAYSITNINNDMQIPRLIADANFPDWVQNFLVEDEEEPDKLKYNSFRQNSQGLYGKGQAPNLTAKFDGENICTTSTNQQITLGGEICNRGAKPVGRNLPATFYLGDVTTGPDRQIICTAIAESQFQIGECARVECVVPDGIDIEGQTITMVGNDNGSGQPFVEECNKLDNKDRTDVGTCPVN